MRNVKRVSKSDLRATELQVESSSEQWDSRWLTYNLVDIDVKEESTSVLSSELAVDGGDLLARSAPIRMKKKGITQVSNDI